MRFSACRREAGIPSSSRRRNDEALAGEQGAVASMYVCMLVARDRN